MNKKSEFNLNAIKNEILAENNPHFNSREQKYTYSRKKTPMNTKLEEKPHISKKQEQDRFKENKNKSRASPSSSKNKLHLDKEIHPIVGKTTCGGCQLQKKILDKEYYSYQVVPLPFFKRFGKKEKFEVKKSWATAETSVQENFEALGSLNKLYGSDKIDENEYNRLKKTIIDSIITAEEMNTPEFEEIRNKFEFLYIDKKDDPSMSDKAKTIFNNYNGDAYPMFAHNKCRAKKQKDGTKTRSHCKEDGTKGVRGLIYFHKSEVGESNLEIITDLQNMLGSIADKYDANDEIANEIKKELDSNIEQLQSQRDKLSEDATKFIWKKSKKSTKKQL